MGARHWLALQYSPVPQKVLQAPQWLQFTKSTNVCQVRHVQVQIGISCKEQRHQECRLHVWQKIEGRKWAWDYVSGNVSPMSIPYGISIGIPYGILYNIEL
jgi:hypothetical protein